MNIFGTMQKDGAHLTIGGCKVTDLAKEFGTPLYVIDEAAVKQQMQTFSQSFQSTQFDTHVIYASKSFTNLYMMRLIKEQNLHLDVVSGGELFIALKAGVAAENIYFHGNNKSIQEITQAMDAQIGTFIVDNMIEFNHISRIAKEKKQHIRVLLRVNPGIEAKTHKYIQTTTENSKFGISTKDPRMDEFITQLTGDDYIDFAGFHCHIGSQVKDVRYFFEEAETIVKFAKGISTNHNISIDELNLGGGFGVAHSREEETIKYTEFLNQYIDGIEGILTDNNLSVNVVSIEPGRALINNAGSTLYSVGGVKDTGSGTPFVLIDGGMSDNIRPALYQGEYTR